MVPILASLVLDAEGLSANKNDWEVHGIHTFFEVPNMVYIASSSQPERAKLISSALETGHFHCNPWKLMKSVESVRTRITNNGFAVGLG